MGAFLMIDIGAGTMDMLYYDPDSGEHFKAVVPSPVRDVARAIRRTSGALAVTGMEMGGGPVTAALQERAAREDVRISLSAAATLHHDPDRVRQWGLQVEPDDAMARYVDDPAYTEVVLADVQAERIWRIVGGMGFDLKFEVVALCAQDHGTAPKGVSHLDFRHNLHQDLLGGDPRPERLMFRSDQVPPAFNRLRCMASAAKALNAAEIYVMDSGMAAILGASQDLQLDPARPAAVLDIATSHTVGAVVHEDRIAGYFEYHTHDITLDKLERLLRDLPEGRIDHARVLAEGGHGAFLHETVGFDALQGILATGPKRRLVADSQLPVIWGAPWGDNMMTGTVGLLEAVRRVKGMEPVRYL
ncbi:MAG: DUF1786 family protein [Desulfosarcinaceae bacterium]